MFPAFVFYGRPNVPLNYFIFFMSPSFGTGGHRLLRRTLVLYNSNKLFKHEIIIFVITMKRNWFYILSPCILAAIFSLLTIIGSVYSYSSSGGWSMIGVIIFVPVLIAVIGLDLLIKMITKKNVLVIWIVELIIIVIAYKLSFQFLYR